MSFTPSNLCLPWFVIYAVIAYFFVPLETPAAETAFWVGLIVTGLLVRFVVALAEMSGGAGFSFVISLGLGLGAIWWSRTFPAPPVLKALAPWIAIYATPVLSGAWAAAGALAEYFGANRALAGLRECKSPDGLLVYLRHPQRRVRDAARSTLDGFSPDHDARACLVLRLMEEIERAEIRDSALREFVGELVEPITASRDNTEPALLCLYERTWTWQRADEIIESRLFAPPGPGDQEALLRATEARLDHGGFIDATVLWLKAKDGDAAAALAERAFLKPALKVDTVLEFSPDVAARILRSQLDAAGADFPGYRLGNLVEGAARLPPKLGLPILAAVLTREPSFAYEPGLEYDKAVELLAQRHASQPGVLENAASEARALLDAVSRYRAGLPEEYSEYRRTLWAGLEERLRRVSA